MGKTKDRRSEESVCDLIVIWYDGFGAEHQATDKKASSTGDENQLPLRWEFTTDEAEALCKKQIKKGALRAEAWRPGSTPEKIVGFERSGSGECRQTYPRKA